MRRLTYILLLACSSVWAQPVQAPLQTFISGGVATGANHPSTSIPTHFSNFGQPFFLPRTENTQNGGGVGNASVLMFGPQVTSQAPAMSAINVPLNADLVLTFDVPIAKGTGDILIRQFPENSTWQPITVTTSDVEVDGATLTIHANNFPPNHVLYLIIPNGAIMDLAGNFFGGYSDDTGWKFTSGSAADTTPPTINGLFPPDNGISAPISDNMIISFSEPVVKGSGFINVRRSDDNSLLDQVDIATGTSVSGTDVTIDALDFPLLTQLYVTISAGGYLDLSGNGFAGIADNDQTSWNFTTVGDTSPPTVQSLLPADGALNVPTNFNLQITFTENVVKGSGTITIRRPSDDLLIQSISLTNDVSINGSIVTINSPDDLPQNMYLYVSIPAGTFKDPFGNDFAGILDNTTWNFTTAADLTAPGVISKSPIFAATGVPINSDLVLTFDEPVTKGTSGDIIIRRFSDNAALQAITVTTSQVIASGSTITIQTNDFPVLTELYVVIPSGAIKDPAGNAFAGYNDNTGWKFTTSSSADVTPPVVQTLSPLDDATGVAVNSNLSITFSENVTRAAGTIFIRKSDNTIVEQFDIPTETSVSGNVVTIDPVDFSELTALHVTISAGGFLDISGNAYAGISSATAWNFTTTPVPPVVLAFAPGDDATGVPINSDLVITFSESIQKGAGSITIRMVSNDAVVQTISLASDVVVSGSTATINPPSDLAYNTPLYVSIPAGTFEDLLGNDYAGTALSTTWNFTTVLDTSPPLVVSTTPANGATGILVASNLTILFNEPIVKGVGNITIRRVSDDVIVQVLSLTNDVSINASTVTINPPVDLPLGGTLYVSIPAGAFEDLSGNDFAGFSTAATWSFTTQVDTSPPVVINKSPAMDATGVSVNTNLFLTFDKPIMVGQLGNIEIRTFPGNVALQNFSITAANVSISGAVLSIDPGSDLPANTDLYIDIPAFVISSVTGVSFAGFHNDPTGWKFRTAGGPDPRGPQITGTVPITGATGVATNGSLVVNFDEPVVKGTGVILLVRSIDSSIAETIDVSTGLVTINGSTVIIHHSTTFPAGTGLHVIISGTAFRDANSNPSPGIYLPSVWNFTTAVGPDATAPTANYSPISGATNVLIGANLTITFNEPVVTKTGGNVVIRKLSDSNPVQTLAATSFTGSGTQSLVVNPPNDLAWNTTYFVTMGTDAFEDLAGNPFGGISADNVWRFSTQSDPDGPVIGAASPTVSAANVAIALTVTITDAQSGVTGATIQYRTLGAPNLQPAEPMTLNSSNQLWEKTIATSFVKESGVEYVITATNGAGMTSISPPGLVKINTDDGLRIPYSAWGTKDKNYRTVAVPMDLTKKSVNDVFADELGDQKDKKWRVARYEGGKTIQDYTGNMEPGKGYWLIVKKDPGKPIFSGPGTTIDATSTLGKKITLKDGWNQIGNPYNFPISWSDVTSLASNAAASLVLRTYPGSWTNGVKLDAMEGGFVFHTGVDKDLQIPAKRGPGKYKVESAELRNSIDQEDWEVFLKIEQGDMYNQISGVGMRTLAATGYDRFDGINMPRFENFLELTHPKEIRGYTYSMDVVPTAENYIWDFSIETNLHEDKLSFTWDNTYFGANGKELVLWDENLQRPINMRLNPGYIFDRKRTNNFRVIFGDKEFIEEHTQVKRVVIHQVYPNPAAEDLTVSLGLPAEEWVSVEVHDLLGRRLTTFFEGKLEKGHHEIAWDRTGDEPVGLYLIVVKAGAELATEKVILK